MRQAPGETGPYWTEPGGKAPWKSPWNMGEQWHFTKKCSNFHHQTWGHATIKTSCGKWGVNQSWGSILDLIYVSQASLQLMFHLGLKWFKVDEYIELYNLGFTHQPHWGAQDCASPRMICEVRKRTLQKINKKIWAPVKILYISLVTISGFRVFEECVTYRFPVFCAITAFGGPITSQCFVHISNSNKSVSAILYWLVVWTPLKNISQLGWSFPIYGKIKHVQNHQPV